MNHEKPPSGDFRKLLQSLSHRHDLRRVFDAFTRFAACALAAQTREPEYLEAIKEWEKAELDLFGQALGALVLEMDAKPFEDILGDYYMELHFSRHIISWPTVKPPHPPVAEVFSILLSQRKTGIGLKIDL